MKPPQGGVFGDNNEKLDGKFGLKMREGVEVGQPTKCQYCHHK